MRLRPWLASILRRLAFALSPEQARINQPNRVHGHDETNRQACETPPVVRAVIDVPEAVLEEYRRNNKNQNRDNTSSHSIAKGALIAAIIYAGKRDQHRLPAAIR